MLNKIIDFFSGVNILMNLIESSIMIQQIRVRTTYIGGYEAMGGNGGGKYLE